MCDKLRREEKEKEKKEESVSHIKQYSFVVKYLSHQ